MVLTPNQSETDFESCGIVKCMITPQNGPEIVHEIIYPDGCCNIDGNLVGEDDVFETASGAFLCHNGEPLEVVVDRVQSSMSAYDDLMGLKPKGAISLFI